MGENIFRECGMPSQRDHDLASYVDSRISIAANPGPKEAGIHKEVNYSVAKKISWLRIDPGDLETRITDISSLRSLIGLQSLNIQAHEVIDLAPLARLKKLETLHLSNNHITDLSPLANLPELRAIFMNNNRISDLSSLAGLNKLECLHLSGNDISDLAPLEGFDHLESLALNRNRISDLSPLKNGPLIDDLFLYDNPELTGPEVEELERALPYCKIHHEARKSVLQSEKAIRESIQGNFQYIGEEDIRSNLSRIDHLYILDKAISDFSYLAELAPELTSMTGLTLKNNYITEIDALAELIGLETLDLSTNADIDEYGDPTLSGQINDISAIASLTQLSFLSMRCHQISDISALTGLKQLRYLDLDGNRALTMAQIDQLQKALPKCKIEHNAKK